MQLKLLLALPALGICLLTSGSLAQQATMQPHSSDGHVMVAPGEIKWQPLPRDWTNGPPPPLGAGAPPEIAVIWGDPSKEGEPFMFRLRSSTRGANVPIPPHYHPTDERLTVISGVFCLGTGTKYDEQEQRHAAGSSWRCLKVSRTSPLRRDSVLEVMVLARLSSSGSNSSISDGLKARREQGRR